MPRNKSKLTEEDSVEYFLIDEESLVNLTGHIGSLEDTVDIIVAEVISVKEENERFKEQLADLERRINGARRLQS